MESSHKLGTRIFEVHNILTNAPQTYLYRTVCKSNIRHFLKCITKHLKRTCIQHHCDIWGGWTLEHGGFPIDMITAWYTGISKSYIITVSWNNKNQPSSPQAFFSKGQMVSPRFGRQK